MYKSQVFTCSENHKLSFWISQQNAKEFGNSCLGGSLFHYEAEAEKKEFVEKSKISQGA